MNINDQRPASSTNITSSKAPLDQAILRLESEIGQLSEGLAELYSRLSPVLGEGKANPINKANTPPIGSSAAVEMMQTLASRIEMMHEELDSIRSRLEV